MGVHVCIATTTPEDGRLADETLLQRVWLLAVAALEAGKGLHGFILAPLSSTKLNYFLNSTQFLQIIPHSMNCENRKQMMKRTTSFGFWQQNSKVTQNILQKI